MRGAAALVVVGLLAGCGGVDQTAPDGTSDERSSLYTAYESVAPSSSLPEVVSFAHQLSVFEVVGERYDEPGPGAASYVARRVTPQVQSTPWLAPGRQELPLVEFVVDGSIAESGRPAPRNEGGAFVVGGTYLAAVLTSQGRPAPLAGAVWELDGVDVLRNPQSPAWAQELAELDLAGVARAFEDAPVVEWARPFLHVEDGGERLAAAQRAEAARVTPSSAADLVERLRRFATTPTDDAFVGLPLAPQVGLGLGERLLRTVPADDLRDPAAWRLEAGPRAYAGSTGPFDVLATLRKMPSKRVVIGPHDHCASPPRPAPAGLDDAVRVSAQPHDVDGCLPWSTVDLFVREGRIVAITLDYWEP